MSLTKATYSMISGACVNVLDFGADPTGATDSTAAIALAIAQGGCIWFPKGVYKCNIELNGKEGIYLLGESQAQYGTSGARLIPQDNTKPVINITTDCTSCVVENFVIDSKLDSTFSRIGIGIQLYARSPHFVWRCAVRHVFIRGFQDGLVMDCDINISEIFDCDFQDVETIGCSRYSFKTRGVYNRFGKLFATQCGISGGSQPSADYGIYHDGSNCFFDSMISDGRQYWAGTGDFVGIAAVESIYGPGVGAGYNAMELTGTGFNTWTKVRLNGVPAAKYSIGVRIAGTNQTIGDLVIEGANYPTIPVLFAGGSTGILGNATQPSAATKAAQPSGWYFTGSISDIISGGGPTPFPWVFKDAWDGTSFTVPDGTWNLVLNPNAAPLATGTLVMPQTNPPLNGQVLRISTSKTITSMTFSATGSYAFWSGASITQTFTAGTAVGFIFRSADNKWYPN